MSDYYMHFVGSGLYNTKRFINESKRIGVQRAVQFNLLRHMKWGQSILVAEHKKIPLCNKEYHDMPTAVIFGYFTVDSLSYNLPDDVKEAFMKKVTVLDYKDYSMSGGMQEERACGSYGVSGCYYVADEVEDLVGKIEEACTECKHDPNEFKYFLKGSLTVLPAPVVLYHKKFSRGYSHVSIEELDIKQDAPKKALFFLQDYNRRMYLKKEERDRIDSMMITEFVESST